MRRRHQRRVRPVVLGRRLFGDVLLPMMMPLTRPELTLIQLLPVRIRGGGGG